mgnify:FL=1
MILQETLKYGFLIAFFLLLFISTSCDKMNSNKPINPKYKVAFMPDIHFHDVFGRFGDGSYQGLETEYKEDTRFATIRTMESQLNSTRLFNENYFAFIAALDKAVEQGITYIAIPGDFSDDGQPVNVRGLKQILARYEAEYGVRFFLAPGNHDPNRPIDHAAGKHDFLGQGGREQPIFSNQHPYCKDGFVRNRESKKQSHPLICSDEVREYGYENILNELGEFGFKPDTSDYYFETPYSSYTYENYTYQNGAEAALFNKRLYEICNEGTGGTYKKDHYTRCTKVGDLSYLVEPVEGLWLLSIDANIYQPKTTNEPFNPANLDHFNGSGNAGYNRLVTHKQHIIEWISTITRRADTLGKQLVAFSHFPMTEFYDNSYDDIAALFGTDGALQQKRMPLQQTSQVLLNTGLKFHIGGHMHQNDTGVFKDEQSGETLINIQAPSIAAYKPAFKKLSFVDDETVEVETIKLDDVPNFRTLFPHYKEEWAYLDSINYAGIWSKEVMNAASYSEFTNWHIRELARLRFFPENWPKNMKDQFLDLTGGEMLALFAAIKESSDYDHVIEDSLTNSKISEASDEIIIQNGMNPQNFRWTGKDVVLDFHRLLNAGKLAFSDITNNRLTQYRFMASYIKSVKVNKITDENKISKQLYQLFIILEQFISEEPSVHFHMNLETGEIVDIQ